MAGGGTAALSAGVTMDRALVWDLFTNTIEASTALGADAAFRERVRAGARRGSSRIRSAGAASSRSGREDFEEEDPQHRHFSHLFGVHPGREITREGTPRAVRRGAPRDGAARRRGDRLVDGVEDQLLGAHAATATMRS